MATAAPIATSACTAATTPSFLCRVRTRVVDFFLPELLRREYRNLIAYFSKYRYAYMALTATILFATAEYEQPGYFPRPQELTVALFGFLGTFLLIFSTFALMEYVENHTWPWDDEGFVWPWEALLWSGTVYNDETVGDGVAENNDANITASLTFGSTTPAGSPDRPEIIIPPTPLLPRGLRPVYLPLPPMHRSGLLGESPMPVKFKHFSGHSDLENVEE